MPRTAAQSVTELHTLLQNAGEKPPYVLVGHSFGGTNVRIFAHRYPGEIVGILLADTGNENEPSPGYFQKLLDAELERRRQERRWGWLLYQSGISRLEARADIDNPALTYNQQEWAYFVIQPKFMAAAASELETMEDGKRELRAAGSLGDKPLLILIAGDSLLDLPLTPEEKAELNVSWIEFEKRLASLSSRGKWVLVPGSGHMLPFARPDAIVNAARDLWAGAKPQ
jgi:pimeloyl-ACP methyl ester carboxylesterase